MADVEASFTDISHNPPTQNPPSMSIGAATNKYNANRNGSQSSGLKSLSQKRLIIGVSVIAAVIIIILCIVLPVVLTRKSNSSDTTTIAPTNTVTVTASVRQKFLTKCQSSKSIFKESQTKTQNNNKVKMPAAPEKVGNRILIKNTYMVEFPPGSSAKSHFRTVTRSLKASEGIEANNITQRVNIDSTLFSGVSFTVNVNHSIESIEAIEGAIALHPVYSVPPPKPIKSRISPETLFNDGYNSVNSYNLTGTNQVHNKFNNYGAGVRVAVIDTGVYYLHPALGGCFGPGCKVAFGYDFVGDDYSSNNPIPVPDSDPLDDCSHGSHGTHVAGIIAANATGITEAPFISSIPFIGVAPQVTIGAYRVFGCRSGAPTDAITGAIYRAYNDKVDIINLSLGNSDPYASAIDAIAAQRVSQAGVYVVAAAGNEGNGGLQTVGSPANALGIASIGSIDSSYALLTDSFIIITPDGRNVLYQAGTNYGGWKSIVNLTIVVNDPSRPINDGCSGLSKSVLGAVVLFSHNENDECDTTTRCNQAELQGAAGCLFYSVDNIAVSGTNIPSGSISLADGLNIVAQIATNPTSIYTFTDILPFGGLSTQGTPSYFSSIGLTGDLLLKPQLSGIGGYVYSTYSLYAASAENINIAYNTISGTSMATPYIVGTLALFLASLGNPSASTVNGDSDDGICRPSFETAMNIFQSTAQPRNIYNLDLLATAAQQGAGLVNTYHALTSTTIISPSELSLNDTVKKASSYKVNVTNIGNTLAKYNISHKGAALATGKASNDDQLLAIPRYTPNYAVVTFDPSAFELGSGETREITLRFTPPTGVDSNLLPIYSGFVYVTNQLTGEAVHLTYAGVVGDYSNARIIVRDSSISYKTGIGSQSTNSLITEDGETLDGSETITVQVSLAWSTRIFGIAVTGPYSTTSLGVLVSSTNDAVLEYNVPRNTAIGAMSLPEAYVYTWSGHIYITSDNALGSAGSVVRLSSGQYRLRFAALKHFGNASNPNDFETYYSPRFNLVY